MKRDRLMTRVFTALTGILPSILALVLSFDFWSHLLKDPVAGIVAMALLEGVALLMFILHVSSVKHPLTWMRHIQPLLAAFTSGEVFGMYMFGLYNDALVGSAAGVAFAGLIGYLVYSSLHALEQTFLDPVELEQERKQEEYTARKQHQASLVDAFKAELVEARNVLMIAQQATEAKRTEIGTLNAQRQLTDNPQTISDFRNLGLSQAKASRASRLAKSGELTPELLQELLES